MLAYDVQYNSNGKTCGEEEKRISCYSECVISNLFFGETGLFLILSIITIMPIPDNTSMKLSTPKPKRARVSSLYSHEMVETKPSIILYPIVK